MYLHATHLINELEGAEILHFAPEKHIAVEIKRARPTVYIGADLSPASSEIKKVDILDIPFADQSFNFVIANHVLEHVTDDLLALMEIYRVLKYGGWAILQTPYSPILMSTWEDDGITTAAARWLAYGQEDHVRLYGKDIFERFSSCGLEPLIKQHGDVLAHVDAARFGVNPREPFFLFRKVPKNAS